MHRLASFVALAATLVAAAGEAAAAPVSLVGGSVDEVVAVPGLVAIRRGGRIRVLRADGTTVFAWPPAALQTATTLRPPWETNERILDVEGVPEEERDSPAAEELAEEELTLAERRQRRAPSPPGDPPSPRPLLAAGGSKIWIAAGTRLWSVDLGGPSPLFALPAPATALGAARGLVVVANGAELLASPDGRSPFVAIARAPEPVTSVAVSPDGRVLAFAGGTQVGWRAIADGTATTTVESPTPATGLRFCGPVLTAVIAGRLRVVDQGVLREGVALGGARHVACDGDPGPWFAADGALLVSSDRWSGWRVAAGGAEVNDVAVAGADLWLGTKRGLYRVDRATPGSPARVASPPASPTQPLPPWLPRVSLAATRATSAGRQEMRLLALADFPLGDVPGVRREAPAPVPEDPPPPPLPADPDAGCLVEARTRAVALALADPDRARSLVARARRAAWLPELRLRVDRRLGRAESLDPPRDGGTPLLGLDTADDVRYEARATWDLSKLVFSSEELAAEAQALRMTESRRDLESAVARLYFERRRLQTEPPAEEEVAHIRRQVRVEEIEAELDALSGGAFGRCTTSHGRVPSR